MNNRKENITYMRKYLDKYKKPCNPTEMVSKSRNTMSNVHHNKSSEYIPNEIYFNIFSYLSPQDLMTCSCVCKKWNLISQNNLLWQPIAKSFFPHIKCAKVDNIKNEIFKTNGVLNLTKQDTIRLRKIDKFTFLSSHIKEYLLEIAKLRLAIIFYDCRDRELYPYYINEFLSSATMSLSFIWNNASTMEKFNKENELGFRIYALLPLFSAGKEDNKRGPYRRILIENYKENSRTNTKVICEDKSISIEMIKTGGCLSLYISPWKQGSGSAFYIAQINILEVLKKLKINKLMPIFKTVPNSGELDAKYGLHDYTCSIELSNGRSTIWKEQFQHVDASRRDDANLVKKGYKRFWIISPDNKNSRYAFKGKLNYPWKNDCFSGVINNACIVDILLLDEFNNPFWTYSQINAVQKIKEGVERMDYDSSHSDVIRIINDNIEVEIGILLDETEKTSFVVSLFCDVNLSYINQHFHTSYA